MWRNRWKVATLGNGSPSYGAAMPSCINTCTYLIRLLCCHLAFDALLRSYSASCCHLSCALSACLLYGLVAVRHACCNVGGIFCMMRSTILFRLFLFTCFLSMFEHHRWQDGIISRRRLRYGGRCDALFCVRKPSPLHGDDGMLDGRHSAWAAYMFLVVTYLP